MTSRARWRMAVVLLTGILAAGVRLTGAQESQSRDAGAIRTDPVVVTATRFETPFEAIGASVTVVPDEVLRAHEYRTVEEALRAVPGLDIQRSGTLGRLTAVRIRGANPTQVQVLIDGVRVKSTTSGDFDFADLTLDAVERIEVLRGPQSTLYGADAIGGVVNIITRRGRGTPSLFADVEVGNYDTFRERVGASGAIGPWRFSLGASRTDFGGQFANEDYGLTSANARAGYDLPNRGELSLVGRFSDARRGLPFRTVFPDFDSNRRQDDQLGLLSLEWRQPWTEWYESALRTSVTRSKLVFRDPAEPGDPLGFDVRSDIDSDRREVDWVHRLDLWSVNTATIGLEYRNEGGEVRGSYEERTDAWALFVQDELRPIEGLSLTGGVRFDHNSAFGDRTTGRAGISYRIKATDTRLKGSWAEGFRAPTFNELFFPPFDPCPSFGNPSLRPEKSRSWDAGIEQQLWGRRVRLSATYFHTDFEDLIQPALIDAANFCFQAANVGRARTQGVEVEASVTPLDGLVLTLAYTYTDAEDRTTGDPLRRVAPNRWSITGVWEALRALTLSGEVLVVSSQFEGPGLPRNEGYTVVNVGGAYRVPWRPGILKDLTLHLRIVNLLNEDYAEVLGFPALGTHVVAGLGARF